MNAIKEIVEVYDRPTLNAAIRPYRLRLKDGSVLKSRILSHRGGRDKETFLIECQSRGGVRSREVYQIEYIKGR